MSLLTQLSSLIKDPPPAYLFELSEAGISYARPVGDQKSTDTGFVPFEPGALLASPVEDNLLKPDTIAHTIARIAPADGQKKRRPAAIILPDYAARVSVLDFDSFPSAPAEQLSLIRFRLKKTLPFDIDSAAVSYFAQPVQEQHKVEVVAVTVAFEVIARYEALFRAQNFHPGQITTSSLAAINLYKDEDVAVIAKLAGRVLTVMVLAGGALKLFRCVPLEEMSDDNILLVLYPTLAYVEDELKTTTRHLILCGFPEDALRGLRQEVSSRGDVGEVSLLRGSLGAAGPHNAGLLGFLEGAAL